MPSIAVDTGPFISLFDRDEPRHKLTLRFFETVTQNLVTNIAVVTEVSHLLDFDARAVRDFLGWADTAIDIDCQTANDIPQIVAIMAKYKTFPADFADASLIAMCERRGIGTVATFDKDFAVYRLANRKQLINVIQSAPGDS